MVNDLERIPTSILVEDESRKYASKLYSYANDCKLTNGKSKSGQGWLWMSQRRLHGSSCRKSSNVVQRPKSKIGVRRIGSTDEMGESNFSIEDRKRAMYHHTRPGHHTYLEARRKRISTKVRTNGAKTSQRLEEGAMIGDWLTPPAPSMISPVTISSLQVLEETVPVLWSRSQVRFDF
ncbi:hypothetical protein CC1G_09625 [Coprinopsis cinerea okayama7|uniref:Uncharacterized protein n=1 Tax=Coprinopsis cinerea (strain Okayama-7 / 130 / ATCC MYA-4618 / FGSC 9003) TaxID=240176 RepID=A8N4E1_COPC7|nr:hypothetical protein CC1G_09625 [Coprinopsis cinerea okayama7\|eukprot:XP_001829736.2 hypothetical protein CC1G_09625 [Coprinopsis cinerea okayama7\